MASGRPSYNANGHHHAAAPLDSRRRARSGRGRDREPAPGDGSVGVGEPEDSDAEGDWEMVPRFAVVVAPELPDAAENSGETGSKAAVDTRTRMEVDGRKAAGEPKAGPAPGDARVDVGEPEDSDAEGEWEMTQERAGQEISTNADASAATAGVVSRKLIEMVAALCKRDARQRVLIRALAERVDSLERTVRRMEDAKRMAK
ncbi:hypothetical protein SETIT_8G128500v2 [Setaria italica]|uniref:Uncharacterized protein n=2 Tax=Setaria TaxID=4554 RepID=K3ZNG1_SETIT|nr:hypothetical protein SETIT_8G128500v2 [Setaria italica]TKW00794.1 hypothetical protein SEVIR_8G135500v2 [Setaria viridis]